VIYGKAESKDSNGYFQGKITVAEVSRKYNLTPAMIEEWIEDA